METLGEPKLVFQGSQKISGKDSEQYSFGLRLNQIRSLFYCLLAYEHSGEKNQLVVDYIIYQIFPCTTNCIVPIFFPPKQKHTFAFLLKEVITSPRVKIPCSLLIVQKYHSLVGFHSFAKSVISTLVYDLCIASTSKTP
uniref:Uncharacterized protein n=1 Tax=Rousettus aegyptiacus TaxID=9407 RepID=A0A7J8E8S2_ROUAE|nr:hypothetical protein HJG63_008178 [Rousettus aegyptiacus]